MTLAIKIWLAYIGTGEPFSNICFTTPFWQLRLNPLNNNSNSIFLTLCVVSFEFSTTHSKAHQHIYTCSCSPIFHFCTNWWSRVWLHMGHLVSTSCSYTCALLNCSVVCYWHTCKLALVHLYHVSLVHRLKIFCLVALMHHLVISLVQ